MALVATPQEPRDTLPSLKQGVTPADTKLTIRHGLFGNKVPIQVRRPAQTLAPASLTLKATKNSALTCMTSSPFLLCSAPVCFTQLPAVLSTAQPAWLLPIMLRAQALEKDAECKQAQC